MPPLAMIAACTAVADAELGVLAARCPHCQGYFELRPATDRIEIGYCAGTTPARFDVALVLAVDGLVVEHEEDPPVIVLRQHDRRWQFAPAA